MDTYDKIDKAIEDAQQSVIPFQVSDGDELAVVGDANATELNKHDFTITFKIPKDGKYKEYVKKFKDVYLKPRHETRLVKFMTEIMPFYRRVNDGDVVKYEIADREHIKDAFSEDLFDLMYEIVATVLEIDPQLTDYMTQESVSDAMVKIVKLFPELVNESDTFFE